MSEDFSSQNHSPKLNSSDSFSILSEESLGEEGSIHLPYNASKMFLEDLNSSKTCVTVDNIQSGLLHKNSSSISFGRRESFNDKERHPIRNKSVKFTIKLPTSIKEDENKVKPSNKNSNFNNKRNHISGKLPAKKRGVKTKRMSNSEFCKNCYTKIDKLIKVQACPLHEFCENCLKNTSNYNSCDDCALFIKSRANENCQVSPLRSHCKKEPLNIEIKCELHAYCRKCDFLMIDNHVSPIFDDCNKCSKGLKSLKFEEERKSESSSFESLKNNENGIDCLIDKPKNEDSEATFRVTEKTCANKTYCGTKVDNLLYLPTCIDHGYCENCIQKDFKELNCMKCNRYLTSKKQENNLFPHLCSLCSDLVLDIHLTCKLHSYCHICSEFLLKNDFCHVKIVDECEVCKLHFIKIKGQEVKESKENADIPLKSYQNLEPSSEIEKSEHKYVKDFKENTGIPLESYQNLEIAQETYKSEPEYIKDSKGNTELSLEYNQNLKLASNIEKSDQEYIKDFKENTEFALEYKQNLELASDTEKKETECVKNYKENAELPLDFSQNLLVTPETDKSESKCAIGNEKMECSEPDTKSELKTCSNENCGIQGNKLFKTSRCSQHEYCERCIKIEGTKIACNECQTFFRCLEKNFDLNNRWCRLCKAFETDQKFKCNSHGYCEICYNYLVKNNFSHIEIVIECIECFNYFENIKSERQNKDCEDSSLGKNTELNTYENSKSEDIDQKSFVNDNVSKILQSKPSSNLKKCSSKNCDIYSERLFKTPRCMKHEFCEKCFKSKPKKFFDCYKCYNYFYSTKKRSSFSSYSCSICDESTSNPVYKCKSHRYCEICKDFLLNNEFTHISFVYSCSECKVFFNISKSQYGKNLNEDIEISSNIVENSLENISKIDFDPEYALNGSQLGNSKESDLKNFRICKKCDTQKEKLFKTPKCNEHEFCLKCLNSQIKLKDCYECYKYFRCLEPSINIYKFYCLLCHENISNIKDNCRLHSYCEECSDFLKIKGFAHFSLVYNCADCKLHFEGLQAKDRASTEENPNPLSNSSDISSENNLKNEIVSKIVTSFEANEHRIASKLKKCSTKTCKNQLEKLYKIPRCSKHEYCENCIKSKEIDSRCEYCSKYFSSLRHRLYYRGNCCYLCFKFYEDKKIVCKEHKFCKTCYDSSLNNEVENIIMLTECKECELYFINLKTHKNKIPEINESPTSDKKTNSIENLKKNEQSPNKSSDYDLNLLSVNNKAKIYKCSNCSTSTDKTFKTPRCKDHEFCINCISNENLKKNCAFCKMYLESISRKKSDYLIQCTFCEEYVTTSKIKCNSHFYCKYCFEFLIKNDYFHLKTVTNCEKCKDSLNTLKNKQTANPVASKDKEPKKNEHITTGTFSNKHKDSILSTGINSDLTTFKKESETKDSIYKSKLYGYYLKSSSGCSGCYKTTEEEFKTPRCTQHKYCKDCIKEGPNYYKCEYCSMYFESIKKLHDPSILKCSLCKLAPINSDIKCKTHSYCKECYEFITKNDYSYLIKVASCQDCCKSLNFIKEKNTSGPHPKENTEKPSNIIESSKSPTFNSSTNAFTHYDDVPKESKTYTEKHSMVKYTLEGNNKNFDPSTPEPNYSSTPSYSSVSYKSKSYYYQDPKDCYIDSNDLIKCNNCTEKLNIKGFLCNHNLCIYCLVKFCCTQITNFFNLCNQDPEKVRKFDYYCLFQSCNKKISVPTKMIFLFLEKFLKDPAKSHEFENFRYMVDIPNKEQWIVFLDGII